MNALICGPSRRRHTYACTRPPVSAAERSDNSRRGPRPSTTMRAADNRERRSTGLQFDDAAARRVPSDPHDVC